jgi:hypothetical protein
MFRQVVQHATRKQIPVSFGLFYSAPPQTLLSIPP